jgi:hypothetical protein
MPAIGQPGEPKTVTVTIAIDASLSDEADLEGYTLVGIHMPAAWTAAGLSFQVATISGGTFCDAYDDAGTEVTVSAAASRYIGLTSADALCLSAARFLKVRSGTTGTPVNQAAARTITLVLKS